MAILHVDVVRETTVPHCQMYQRLRNQPLGARPNLEDGNASANVSINDNDSDEFIEGTKRKNFSRRSFTFEEMQD